MKSSFRLKKPNQLTESLHILLGNTAETFMPKELSQLLPVRFVLTMLWGMRPISLLIAILHQGIGHASGFAGISTTCWSTRLITQSEFSSEIVGG
jgi:hypothetical protein